MSSRIMAFDQATKQHLEKEMLPFLTLDTRLDVKGIALRYFLDMTGSKEGRDFIGEGDKFLSALCTLTLDENKDISQDAYCCLINLSSEDKIAWKLMNVPTGTAFILEVLKRVLKSDCKHADEATSVVANVTRLPACARTLAGQILAANSKVTIEGIVQVLCQVNFNKNAQLHLIGPILANLTQDSGIRKVIMDRQRCIVQKLLPFTEYKGSNFRRGGIIGALKNCCFEYDYHNWLLSEEVDILPRLLLPLAGGEEFDEDDMDRLPVDLQYLPPDKEREQDPELRLALIEAITQLCCTKQGRLYVKEKNAYVILRELHKWERDAKAKLACTKLCEMLISDEPQAGMEELHKVEIPADLIDKFEKMDAEMLKDIEEEEKEKAEQELGQEQQREQSQEKSNENKSKSRT